MPSRRRRALTEREKYLEAKENVNEILRRHTLEEIKSKMAEYKRLRRAGTNDTTLRVFHNLYKRYERLRKKIVTYELSVEPQRCANCQR